MKRLQADQIQQTQSINQKKKKDRICNQKLFSRLLVGIYKKNYY